MASGVHAVTQQQKTSNIIDILPRSQNLQPQPNASMNIRTPLRSDILNQIQQIWVVGLGLWHEVGEQWGLWVESDETHSIFGPKGVDQESESVFDQSDFFPLHGAWNVDDHHQIHAQAAVQLGREFLEGFEGEELRHGLAAESSLDFIELGFHWEF